MDATDIKVLLEVGERISFECKKAENNIPKSVWETYSSFANTIGGIIVLGITENVKFVGEANHFEITGITNPQKLRKEFFDTLNSNKVNRNILTDSDVEIIDYEGVPLMCITVPQADYRQRPIYINGNMMNGAFKRNYEGDYHCTEEDVKAMIRDANDSGNDGILIEHYNIDDIDSATFNAYRNRFRTANPDHIWNDYDDKDFLLNIGAYIRDRNTRREGLTLAGLLVFGKGLSIRERFDNIRMDYLDFTNLEEESRWSDRLTYDGRWENNLYNFFMRVQSKLISDIKRPFSLKGMERNDDSLLHKAIREALTNLIIHADYMLTGVLKVEKYDNRFVFSNPGSLKIPVVDIYEGGHSKARNPHIQAILRMIGFGENIGSGFPTILEACKKENWRRPLLEERPDLHLVELTLSMVSLISAECETQLLELYGNDYKEAEKEQQLILATALSEGVIANNTIQLLLDKNPLEAGKLLYALVAKNMLLSTNKGRWTTYSINGKYSQGVENSRSKTQGVENSRSKTQGVEKARSNKKEKIIEHIIVFCQEPHTLQEIAQELGFSDRYWMKKNYIDPLLGDMLQMTSVESKNAPTQKYVAI
ncbi:MULTISPECIES: ATP-binding protein [Capnocytophaga]|uniref:ATP-binding protein n=2 Tax=Flavobacteriaceae TaxID=49546 RepID=UPI00020C5D47|nr:ATP-binding protein [Capnocytophaga sp. FDAARGOS_737]QGS18865.1 AAA family ATPase [Capnocytophaga sp. FDAARGOS_737]